MDVMPTLKIKEDEEGEEDMKAKQKVLLDKFAKSISDGQLSIEDAVKVYRSKSNVDLGESYAVGIQRLSRDPTFAHNFTPEQLEEIQSKYGQWEPPPNTPGTKALRWPNATKKRKAPPPDETVTNQATSIEGPGDPPAPEPKYPGAKYILAAGGAL